MSHLDSPNETAAGGARVVLVAFVACWIALVSWAVRNEERLFGDAWPASIGSTASLAALRASIGGASPGVRPEAMPPRERAFGSAPDADVEAPGVEGSDVEGPDVEGPDIEDAASAGRRVAFDRRRHEELDTLASLLAGIAFEPGVDSLADGARRPLERAFEILLLYPDTRVELVVESREGTDAAANERLDRARGARLVESLASLGIERARLVVRTGGGRGLASGEQRVGAAIEDGER